MVEYLTRLPRIGKQRASALHELGIHTERELAAALADKERSELITVRLRLSDVEHQMLLEYVNKGSGVGGGCRFLWLQVGILAVSLLFVALSVAVLSGGPSLSHNWISQHLRFYEPNSPWRDMMQYDIKITHTETSGIQYINYDIVIYSPTFAPEDAVVGPNQILVPFQLN